MRREPRRWPGSRERGGRDGARGPRPAGRREGGRTGAGAQRARRPWRGVPGQRGPWGRHREAVDSRVRAMGGLVRRGMGRSCAGHGMVGHAGVLVGHAGAMGGLVRLGLGVQGLGTAEARDGNGRIGDGSGAGGHGTGVGCGGLAGVRYGGGGQCGGLARARYARARYGREGDGSVALGRGGAEQRGGRGWLSEGLETKGWGMGSERAGAVG